MPHQFEARMSEKVSDVLLGAFIEIVDAQNVMAISDQPAAEICKPMYPAPPTIMTVFIDPIFLPEARGFSYPSRQPLFSCLTRFESIPFPKLPVQIGQNVL
ncbi:hypothetical protein DSCA_06680 [Desulfosarcina alkanivorans]|uniref:Uncharacterized protein n=1 Tax=Desulfosarcina alkanivorans TaxID=571177 RepID=A0A5K7YC64_9BACT|nr:hypothetical protein [Desulfosarcina alkanivorans]BBO66738.1 hypothetical protein DSCA_06680 [Desulfosarcina alkanivorans]